MSAPNPLRSDLLMFIHVNVSSLEILEILLLMRRVVDRQWTAATISHELRIDAASAERRLKQLERSRLVKECEQCPEAYSYAPPNEESAKLVDELAEAYAMRRLQVMTAVYSKPSEHIQVFADAFRLRKE